MIKKTLCSKMLCIKMNNIAKTAIPLFSRALICVRDFLTCCYEERRPPSYLEGDLEGEEHKEEEAPVEPRTESVQETVQANVEIVDFQEHKEEVPPVEPRTESVQETVQANVEIVDFRKEKKPKKKKDIKALLALLDDEADGGVKGDEFDEAAPDAQEWNYAYDELLDRLYRNMKDRNPNTVTGEKKKFKMPPFDIIRHATKARKFVNFAKFCEKLNRSRTHVSNFVLAELSTHGSINGTGDLIIKGTFGRMHIAKVLSRYVREYITCKSCGSGDTTLEKDKKTRLNCLRCETCNASSTVENIKAGYQAVTSKRSAQRAKED